MRATHIALAASCLGTLIGLAAIPHPLEEVTMLNRDRQFEAAMAKASDHVAAGEARPELLMQTFVLHERYGDLLKANAALGAYLAARPDDAGGWRKAVWFYSNAHRSEPLMHALEQVVRLTGDREAAGRLIRLYRLHGRFADELRVFSTMAPGAMTGDEALRMAALLIADGQPERAIEALRHVDDSLEPEQQDARLLLFDLLVSQGRFAEAAESANRWLLDWRSAGSRAAIVRHLLRAGAGEAAFAVASRSDVVHEPSIMAQLLTVLSQERRIDLLGPLIAAWIEGADTMAARQMDAHLREVAEIAAERGMSRILLGAIAARLEDPDERQLAASLAGAVFAQLGYAGLLPVRHLLTPQALSARPLLAARLLLAEGNRLAARHFLLLAEPDSLSAQQCIVWLETAAGLLPAEELPDELLLRARADDLPDCLMRAEVEMPPHWELRARTMHGAQRIFTIAHGNTQ